MASARFYVLSSVVVMGVAAVLGGCADQNKGNNSYPPPNTPPPSSSSYQSSSYQSSATAQPSQNYSSAQQASMTTPPPVQVPAGARLMTRGQPPLPSFDTDQSGTVYIWDETDNKLALMTSVAAGNGGSRTVNLSEMPNVSNALNNQHTYRVYYVPASAATTLPSPLGQ